METIAHRDYQEAAEERTAQIEALLGLANDFETEELGLDLKEEKEAAMVEVNRANLVSRLSAMTGYPFAIYDQNEMPGAAGFVLTNGEKVIYISTQTLDDPAFAGHVAKHEAYHLKTMLILPVETDFTADHFVMLDKHLPQSFTDNTFYLEGFNEWLTSLNDNKGAEVTAYGPNVKAAQKLEALGKIATGESLMEAFETGNNHKFAHILKTTTDRLMLFESLKKTDLISAEKLSLSSNITDYTSPVAGPLKADLIVDSWIGAFEASKIKKEILEAA